MVCVNAPTDPPEDKAGEGTRKRQRIHVFDHGAPPSRVPPLMVP